MYKKAAFLLLGGVLFLGAAAKILHLEIQLEKIHGLRQGDAVVHGARRVGEVTRIEYTTQGDFLVTVAIEKEPANRVTEYTRFFVAAHPSEPDRKVLEMVTLKEGGAALKSGSRLKGSTLAEVTWEQMWGSIAEALGDVQKELEDLAEELRGIPENEEFKKLRREIEKLTQEIRRAEKETRERVQKEILPRLKKELDNLKRKLRRLQEDEPRAVRI